MAYFGLWSRPALYAGAAVLAGLLFAAVQPAQAAAKSDTPFAALVGTWKGAGTLKLDNGKSESLKCRGYYTERDGGAGLGLAILCASASNKIELRAGLVSAGGRLSGTWEERSFNVGGDVSGQASAGRITLAISGGGFTASMAVQITGSSQSVSITTQGVAMQGVSISLSRD
jgi:hypothetical protein